MLTRVGNRSASAASLAAEAFSFLMERKQAITPNDFAAQLANCPFSPEDCCQETAHKAPFVAGCAASS